MPLVSELTERGASMRIRAVEFILRRLIDERYPSQQAL